MSGSVVIGLGNPLMGDDGFGLVALALLRDRWAVDGVELADGGTWGMSLLPLVEDADRVLLLDAIAAGAPPGTVVILERRELPIYLSRKLSPHQVDMRDVLAAAEWRGRLPSETVAIGAQPQSVELGIGLSAALDAAVEATVDAVVARLRDWGHRCVPLAGLASCTK